MPLHTNLGAAAAAVVTTAGSQSVRVTGLVLDNANAAVRYFQLHNKATAPVNADVPVMTFRVGIGATLVIPACELGRLGPGSFPLGLAWAWSTTRDAATLATASDHVTQVIYE